MVFIAVKCLCGTFDITVGDALRRVLTIITNDKFECISYSLVKNAPNTGRQTTFPPC